MKKIIFVLILTLNMMILSSCGNNEKAQATESTEIVKGESYDNNIIKEKENKGIIVVATENSNYVYHMLSVAKCGYDNAYGDTYKELYQQDDLEILRKNAIAITVAGGEHEGSLYGPIVAEAAALDDSESIVDYYQNILENAESIAKECGEQKDTVEALASVFIKYFKIYDNEIWPEEHEKIEAHVELYQKTFDEMDLVSQWEVKLGYQAKEDFHVMLVDSLENGPEAILIADDKDIFTICDPEYAEMKINFISHELGVSIIKQNGFYGITDTSELLKYYDIFESVAEYYNRQIFEGYELADTWDYDIVNKIQKIDEENHFENAGELFWAAVEIEEVTSEEDYLGADVVEIVNLRGDETTVYKLADGTYMDRIERHFTYNGTDTWTDEDGVEWNEIVK